MIGYNIDWSGDTDSKKNIARIVTTGYPILDDVRIKADLLNRITLAAILPRFEPEPSPSNKRPSSNSNFSGDRGGHYVRLLYCLGQNFWQYIPPCYPPRDSPPYPYCCKCNARPDSCDPDTVPPQKDCGSLPGGFASPGDAINYCGALVNQSEQDECVQSVGDWLDCGDTNSTNSGRKKLCERIMDSCKAGRENKYRECIAGRSEIYISLVRACMGHYATDGAPI